MRILDLSRKLSCAFSGKLILCSSCQKSEPMSCKLVEQDGYIFFFNHDSKRYEVIGDTTKSMG